jgi:hypothetical protein
MTDNPKTARIRVESGKEGLLNRHRRLMRKTNIAISPLLLFISICCRHADAQSSSAPAQQDPRLAFLVTGAISGIVADLPASLQPIVRNTAIPLVSLSSFNSGLAAELSNLPSTSPASSLRFAFDPNIGAYVPLPQSLGPILSERAETLGKDKLYFAITHQRFQFDQQDDLDLRNFRVTVPVNLPAGSLGPSPIQAIAEAAVSVNLVVNQTTAHFTYGVTRWLDVSYAMPFLTSSLRFQTGLNITLPQLNLALTKSAQGSSSGFGDGIARAKAKFYDRGGLALALATEVRLPIGDEFNLHGAGAFGVKPFLIVNYTNRAISPHLNAGFQWNGKSYLASPSSTSKQKLPSQAFYSAGVDVRASKRMTVAFEVLDQIVFNAPGLSLREQTVGTQTFRFVDFLNRTRHEVNGAGGLKVQITRDLVLTGNMLVRLNTAGLRTRVVPLIGLSYLF